MNKKTKDNVWDKYVGEVSDSKDYVGEVSDSKDYEVVKLGTDIVIFEGGYWMNRGDYDFVFYRKKHFPAEKHIGFEVDKKTRQITYFYLPPEWR